MTTWPEPITLRDAHASLMPLEPGHHDGLAAAANDGELWKLWYTTVTAPERMRDEIERRLRLQREGARDGCLSRSSTMRTIASSA